MGRATPSAFGILAFVCIMGLLMEPGAPRPASAQISPGPLSAPHAFLEGSSQCNRCHSKRAEEMDARCLDCHTAVASLRRDGRGLHARTGDAPCASCHPDHAGADFELIHFEEGSPERFDHARAGWPLEGKHASLACRDCHQPRFRQGEPPRREHPERSWLGLDTACATCHRDPHAGALGSDCASCHGPAAWKPASGFDHARTAFPLRGRHVEVACATCHKPAEGGATPARFKPLAHEDCASCHADPHAGRFARACASCHVEEGFRVIRGDGFDHDLTRYPLRGRHAALDCAACHDPGKAWGRTPPFTTCNACHADPHAGQAVLASAPVDCASCHGVEGFVPSTFGVDRHAATLFPLLGKHAETPCAGCHTRAADPEVWGEARVNLRPQSGPCAACHADPHAGQARAGCESCHSVQGFRPAAFDAERHAAAGFPLEGAHAQAACAACHGPARPGLPPLPDSDAVGTAGVRLRPGDRCGDCHLDPHRGRFPETNGSCAACHGFDTFVPSSVGPAAHGAFPFPLEGAHAAVPCTACHGELAFEASPVTLASSGRVAELPFAERRRACVDCHRDPHAGQFAPRACDACHGTDAFAPASRFDHTRDAAFVLDGAHRRVPCASCHPVRPTSGEPVVVYRPVESRCASCHAEKN